MSQGKAQFQEYANALRQELKSWEKGFAANNEGRKAGREDIKANAGIGTFYFRLPNG